MLRLFSLMRFGSRSEMNKKRKENGTNGAKSVEKLRVDMDRRYSDETVVYEAGGGINREDHPSTPAQEPVLSSANNVDVSRLEMIEEQQKEILSLLRDISAAFKDTNNIQRGSTREASAVVAKPRKHLSKPKPEDGLPKPEFISPHLTHSEILSQITPLDPSSPSYAPANPQKRRENLWPEWLLANPGIVLYEMFELRLMPMLYTLGIAFDYERDGVGMMRMRGYEALCEDIERRRQPKNVNGTVKVEAVKLA
ncbi:hypothetical protein ONZ45_g16423 [Pleurotus djamor]|nr:hypothetical protein ONZ45_g16423 [Pleurotus djamor]